MTSPSHDPIAVGMDGSAEAVRAAEYGASAAKRLKVPLRLMFAHRPAPMWGPNILLADENRSERVWADDMLLEAHQRISDAQPNIIVQTSVVSGSPAGVLVDASRRASLVVLGTRAAGGLIGHLSGSVVAQVAAHAHTSVHVIRPTAERAADPTAITDGPVVVGLDGSAESKRAMVFALEQAVVRGDDPHAVYAWNVLEVRDMGAIVPDSFDAGAAEEKALRLLTEATEGWADTCPDLTITRPVIHGLDPVDALREAGDNAGLIVVGSRGHGGFLGLRLGSTVDALIRRTGARIAVVRGEHAAG
jgi:nucleotide-binding universal stress UspA family protein